MPEFSQQYTSRFDTLLKKWVLERHEGTKTFYVATYSDQSLIERVVSILNERRLDVV